MVFLRNTSGCIDVLHHIYSSTVVQWLSLLPNRMKLLDLTLQPGGYRQFGFFACSPSLRWFSLLGWLMKCLDRLSASYRKTPSVLFETAIFPLKEEKKRFKNPWKLSLNVMDFLIHLLAPKKSCTHTCARARPHTHMRSRARPHTHIPIAANHHSTPSLKALFGPLSASLPVLSTINTVT